MSDKTNNRTILKNRIVEIMERVFLGDACVCDESICKAASLICDVVVGGESPPILKDPCKDCSYRDFGQTCGGNRCEDLIKYARQRTT